MTRDWIFGSFFLGGFECSTHKTAEGHRLDMISATQHDRFVRGDYALCLQAGIHAVRESARWPIFDNAGVLNLEAIRDMARAGRELGIVQIWDLMHYGFPDDLDPLAAPAAFIMRLAKFASAVVTAIRAENAEPLYFTAVNEISYNAWASGEVGYMAPFAKGKGAEYKRVLVSAAIAATEAIWDVDPHAVPVSVEPLVHLHAPTGRPDLHSQAEHFNRSVVFEALDMVAGVIEPELGGSRRHLGIVGLNYYSGNQWTIPVPGEPQRSLVPGDPGWMPLSTLLQHPAARYGGPLIIAETGASGDARPAWIDFLAEEASHALASGVDLQGICLYPVITSPDWEDPTAFFDGGAFDISPQIDGTLERVPSASTLSAIRRAQRRLDPVHEPDGLAPPEGIPSGPSTGAPLLIARGLQDLRFKADNFAFRTLLVGEHVTVERYCLGPFGALPDHRHENTEHVLTVLAGTALVSVAGKEERLEPGDSLIVPHGLYHGLKNDGPVELVVQQISTPKPWDSRFGGPHPG